MVLGIDSRIAFSGILLLVILERLHELRLSRRNARLAFARGGVEFGAGHFRWMKLAHTAFLISCLAEVWLLRRPFWLPLALSMTALCVGTMALRYWAVASLGERWNTRVIVIPELPPVTDGPYRWVRHPNYLAVIVELAALPLIHTLWLSALVFSVVNAWILSVRIRVEERALSESSSYETTLGRQGRFLPRRGAGGP